MKLGFVVNPIAGMGGRVGLKGTDNVLREAVARGATPVAPTRAVEFLCKLKETTAAAGIQLYTCPGIMGEREAKEAGFNARVLPMTVGAETSAEDTKAGVMLLADRFKVDLIVFVGGDGTARDVLDALAASKKTELPVIGVPAGVKMYSGVFAVNPSDGAEAVESFANGEAQVAELEVMDADEATIRSDRFEVRLYGYMRCPFVASLFQGSKQVSPDTASELDNQVAAARFALEILEPHASYILGPGTTVKQVAELLGVEKTVLGVDLYRGGVFFKDVDEQQLLGQVKDWNHAWIVVSPIGRQGILFGRGNQQISPQVIRKVGKERIVVVATRNKLQGIEGGVLRVDTGDEEVDAMLRGYVKVVTDYKEWRLMPVK